tara:strand:- start:1625 stop:2077 length:453 start_codon:yes stop_codon:yes gene_type:complete
MALNNPFDSLDKTFDTKDKTKALTSNLKSVREDNNLPAPPADTAKDLEDDFQEARDILKRTADYSEEAIKGMLHIAKNSDQPRAYEVAGQLIKALQDNANAMMDVQEKAKKVKGEEIKANNAAVTNNNLFVGSTKDLLRALKDEQVIEHE